MRPNLVFLFPLVVAAGGCSRDAYQIAPVSGVVTLDGKPLDGARVSFQPEVETTATAPGSVGKTGPDGRFTLATVGGRRDGALPGRHRVQINRPTPQATAADEGPIPDAVPVKYNTQTTLTFDVPPEGTSAADFSLTTK